MIELFINLVIITFGAFTGVLLYNYLERSEKLKMDKSEIKYEIVQNIGILSTNSKSNWSKEFNLISWNSSEPKYDIREWNSEHNRMGKGITFTKKELLELKKLIDKVL